MSTVSTLLAGLAPKDASTGSKGFFVSAKVEDENGRYQANASAWLVGSKNDPKAKVTAKVDDVRTALAAISVSPKEFASGKTGHYGQGKVTVAGQKFQAAIQLVKIG